MRTASRGALSVPADEMLEILVFLSRSHVFGQQARMTLAEFDEAASIRVVAKSTADPEVLAYYWAAENRRPKLMPALIENPAIGEMQLMELASEASRELVTMLLASPRVMNSPEVLRALAANEHVTPQELQGIQNAPPPTVESEGEIEPTEPAGDVSTELEAWKQEHAAEIAAEEGKAFELTGTEAGAEEGEETAAPHPQAAPTQHPVADLPGVKVTLLQKVARMSVAERVKAAFVGSKEERMILIRDGSRVIQNAVMASPKLTDPEVEGFAAAKNLHENVLREIARSRRFMKNYSVVRNLVNNPRCPLDIGLTQVKNLLAGDLKDLRKNKNVSETVRKVAAKLFQDRMKGK
ncbi:MAG TPA: hypothetical protein VEW69_11155, partial [Alphaproteobacteria bacterium]|nr:hypothetical protein [Alphaproteobacteria bacterium]